MARGVHQGGLENTALSAAAALKGARSAGIKLAIDGEDLALTAPMGNEGTTKRGNVEVTLVTPIPLSTVSARVRRLSRSVASHATSKHPCMRGEIHE